MRVDGRVRGIPKSPAVVSAVPPKDRIYNPIGTEIWHDEFNDASIDSGWVRTDASSSSYVTWKEGMDAMGGYHNASASGSGYWHALSYPLPVGATYPLTVETYIAGIAQRDLNYMMVGLAFTDDVTVASGNQATAFGYMSTDTEGAWNMYLRDFNNWNSNVTSWAHGIWGNCNQGLYLRIQYTAANSFRMQWSVDAVFWHTGGTETITCTPTHLSLIHTNWGQARAYVCQFTYARLYDTLTPEDGTYTTIT